MHIFKLAFLFFIFFCCQSLSAQPKSELSQEYIFEFSREYQFQSNARDDESKTVNELLQFISEGSGKLRVFTAFHFSCKVTIVFEPDSMQVNKFKAVVKTINPILTGDIVYKDFFLDQYLLPPFMKIEGVVRSIPDKKITSSFVVDSIQWINNKNLFEIPIAVDIPGNKKEDFFIELKNIDFYYGKDYLNKVVVFKNAFADYYTAESTLNKIRLIAEDLNTINYESIILDEFRLCEAEQLLGNLLSDSFFSVLPLHKSDPAKVIPQTEMLRLYLREMRNEFNNNISFIDTLFYHGAVNHLRSGDTLKAKDFFNRSLVYNSLYMPSHIALGRLNLYSGNIEQALSPFRPILADAPMPGKWKSQTLDFLSEVFMFQQRNAKDAMAEGRYLDALKILTVVEDFCRVAEQWDCPEALFQEIEKVHYGMYRSYLSVAARAYTSYNNDFAVSYIESALEYKEIHSKYIKNDSEAMFLLKQVLDGYYVLAAKASEINDFDAAVSHFNAAADLCARYPSLACSEDANELARLAELKKKEAEIISLPLVINEPSVTEPQLSSDEAIEKVKDFLSKGHLSAWAGEPAKAREYLNQLLPLAIRYNLRQDTLINERIVGLTSMIAEKECEIKRRQLENLLSDVHIYFKKGYYAEAGRSYELARNIQNENLNCSWSLTDSLSRMSYISLAAEYQELFYQAQGAYFRARQGDFNEFFENYRRAGTFSYEHNLEKYGIIHENLSSFAISSANTSLQRYLIEPLANKDQTDDVLALLSNLKDQGFDPRELKSQLQYAGNRAAIAMHILNPDIKPDEWLKVRTGDDPWFKVYSRAFLSNWPK